MPALNQVNYIINKIALKKNQYVTRTGERRANRRHYHVATTEAYIPRLASRLCILASSVTAAGPYERARKHCRR